MAINEVKYGDQILMSTRNDTVTAEGLLAGTTAHNSAGLPIVGMLVPINALDDLDDVDISSPTNNQILKYNATTEKWENGDGGSDEDKMDKNNPRGIGNFAMNLASDQKEVGRNTVCFASPNIYDNWESYEDAPNHTITYVSHTENEVVFSTDWDMDEVDEILKISILYQEDEYLYYDIFVNSIDKENKTLTCQYPIYDGDHQLDVSIVISKQLERAGKYVEVIDDSVDASGDYSFLEGINTVANARGVHVEGMDTTASGEGSHAEGYRTNAIGGLSHAEGDNTTASGSTSHAEGVYATANGYASHAEGWKTIASGHYQHSQGKFNIEDTENEYAFIIGNGNDENNRSNGFTVDWDGNIVASGTITDGDGNILSANVQVDWNQTDSSAADYIKNKPTIPTVIEDLVELNDVNISNPQNDQVLKYDSISQKWVNGTGGGGGESGLIPVDPIDTSNINIWIQTS